MARLVIAFILSLQLNTRVYRRWNQRLIKIDIFATRAISAYLDDKLFILTWVVTVAIVAVRTGINFIVLAQVLGLSRSGWNLFSELYLFNRDSVALSDDALL